jgi:hypothetical protein
MEKRNDHRRGSALVTMLVCVLGLLGLSTGLVMMSLRDNAEQGAIKASIQADYLCHAGLSEAMFRLQLGQSANLGSPALPLEWGGGRFYVEETAVLDAAGLPTGLTRLVATGMGDLSGSRQELVVRAVPNTIWRFGAFGREFLHMDSNARVDSYNSTLGTYAAQATNGSGSNQHARSNGDVGSNGDISLDQNSKVWGDAMAGMNHIATVLGNAVVTGTVRSSAGDVELPSISIPSYASSGNLLVTSTLTLPTGNRSYGTLQVGANKTLTINGPANIVAANLLLKSGSKIVINDAEGPVSFYVIDNFIMNSNSQIYSSSRKPSAVALNLLSDNVINPEVTVQLDTVDFDSNSKIWGVVYAPNARVVFDSNFELFGSMIARSLDLDSNATFHFDEALMNATASTVPTYETVGWRELPWRP